MMTATKQQQLEWLAKAYKTWPEQGTYSLRLSAFEVGKFAIVNCHVITKQEWQQERDRQAELKTMTMQMCELKPLERDKMQKQQDNSWHERGEFPPVGSIVTVANDYETHDISDYSRDCVDAECVVMAVFERDSGFNKVRMVCVMEPKGGCYCFRLSMIRPLRTEREKAIDEMAKIMADTNSTQLGVNAAALYDAGYRKEQPK